MNERIDLYSEQGSRVLSIHGSGTSPTSKQAPDGNAQASRGDGTRAV